MWTIKDSKPVLTTHPFTVEQVDIVSKTGEPASFHRLNTKDWVTVLPITHDRKAILIKQQRIGVTTPVIETPGGCLELGEKDTMMAAVRELEEETGFTSKRVIPLGSINPNPALFMNKVHMFLAFDCMPASPRKHFPDAFENIEVCLYDVLELETLVRSSQINHGIAALTILLARNYLQF